MADAMIKQDRDEPPTWDKAPGGEERPGAGQDGGIGADEVDRRRQRPPFDEGRDHRVGGGIAERKQS